MNYLTNQIHKNIKEVSTYTIDGKKFFKTKEELIRSYKKDEVERIIGECVGSVFDYDQKFYIDRIASNILKRMGEIIEVCKVEEGEEK